MIAPGKVGNRPWDSKTSISPTAAAVVSELMLPGSGATASAVISAVGKTAPQGTAAPDVIGYIVHKGTTTKALAKIAGTPLALALRSNKTQDSYTPRFFASYEGWPVYEGTKFQIQLWDADLFNDDHIAVVELNQAQLLAVADQNEPVWIDVSYQSQNQLLYLLVSVSHSLESTKPKMNGYQWSQR